MRTNFKVRDKEYEVSLEKRERGEGDKFIPYSAAVSGQNEGTVKGTIQLTPQALEAAQKKSAEGSTSVDDLVASASGRALAAEVLIRKLKPDFSFVVDYRWLR
jgi:hypothetical protein